MTATRWKVVIGARFIYIRSDEGKLLSAERDGDAEDTLKVYEQICTEHNAHAAMVEALEQLQKYVGARDANGNEIKFVLKA